MSKIEINRIEEGIGSANFYDLWLYVDDVEYKLEIKVLEHHGPRAMDTGSDAICPSCGEGVDGGGYNTSNWEFSKGGSVMNEDWDDDYEDYSGGDLYCDNCYTEISEGDAMSPEDLFDLAYDEINEYFEKNKIVYRTKK